MVVATLAGRRIDAKNAKVTRFPESNVPRVRREIERLFIAEGVETLVCSAASGADLLALEVAQRLNLRCCVVLPFAPEKFRTTSVVDRSPDWGALFDDLIGWVQDRGDLVLIDRGLKSDEAYEHATEVIIETALKEAFPSLPMAVVVWDGVSRGESDFAVQFSEMAIQKGLSLRAILTI